MSQTIQRINGKSANQIRKEKVLKLAKQKKAINHKDIIKNLPGVDHRFVAFRICQELVKKNKLIAVDNGNRKLNEYRLFTKKDQKERDIKEKEEENFDILNDFGLLAFFKFVDLCKEKINKTDDLVVTELNTLFQMYKDLTSVKSEDSGITKFKFPYYLKHRYLDMP